MMILHRFARTTTDSVTVLLSWCSIGPVNSGSFPAEVCSSPASPIFSIFQLLKKKQNWKHSRLIIFVFDTKKKRESKSLEREIRSLERGTEFLFGQERDCSGLFYFFFFSSPLCGQRADRDQLLPLDWHQNEIHVLSPQGPLRFSFFLPPLYIYIQCIQCNTFSSLFFTFVSERVIRSPFLSSPPLSLPFFPSPPSDRFRPPFSPSEPRMAGTKRERKRAEQGERRKRIRQVASGGSFTDREQRSFERRWKINLFFERSLEKE